jgi:hypothetical protein
MYDMYMYYYFMLFIMTCIYVLLLMIIMLLLILIKSRALGYTIFFAKYDDIYVLMLGNVVGIL